MRLLMTADAVGGVWTYALELCGALAHHGVETVLAVLGPPPDARQRAEAREVPGLLLQGHPGKLEWMDDCWNDVAAQGEWLLALAEKHEADAVHLNGYCHAALPWRVPPLVVAHSDLFSWWRAVHPREPAPAAWRRYADEVARNLREAGAVAAPTRAMLDALDELHGPLRVPTAVIPNARDPALFHPLAKERYVFCAGRVWDEGKNVSLLDEVAALGLDAPVVVAGDPRPPEGSMLPSPRHLALLGRVDDAELRRRYGHAAVLAHPARYEPFGLSVLEGALAGCALVLADIPTLREVWGDAALYAPPDDARAFRDALARVLADDALRARLAEAARARALSYHPRRQAAAYLETYERLARAGHTEDPRCAS